MKLAQTKSFLVACRLSWLAMFGVLIFVASDMILISSMTCKHITGDHSMEIMSTYYTGQLLIALSCIQTFVEDVENQNSFSEIKDRYFR